MLLGRDRECGTLERLLDAVRAGQGAALVVRGESGVGKTALLEHMRERASGCRVVSVSAAKSETHLAFAALHQLCVPLSRRARTPARIRSAKPWPSRSGGAEGVPADPFFLGLAVLSLLSAAADERPLVCLVDDAQWSDPESTQVLGFVARRPPESVALVVAASRPALGVRLRARASRVRLARPRCADAAHVARYALRWTSRSGNGSSPRPRATRSPSSRCRAG